jgi:putative tricarboxylic transport membrane protein
MIKSILITSTIFYISCIPNSFADRLHLLIPAGPGGGLDSTARAVGESLMKLDNTKTVSYENRTGGGGGKAMSYFVNSKSDFSNALLVNSTPLLIRSIQGVFKQTYRDIVPIASLIADPAVIAVKAGSKYSDWNSIVTELQNTNGKILVGGGSVKGSLDHIALFLLLKESGISFRKARYIPYDGGGKALIGLLSSEVEVLVSGLGETINQHRSKSVQILGVSSVERIKELPEVPTFKEVGLDVVFSNWRGLFASKSSTDREIDLQQALIRQLVDSPEWQAQLTRYGWESFYLERTQFKEFLQTQEDVLRNTLIELGLLIGS